MIFIASKRSLNYNLPMIILEIKVIPNSGAQEFELFNEGLKCHIKSSPEKGKANAELVKMLAKKLGLQQHSIIIISGATTRTKLVKLATNRKKSDILAALIGK